MNCAEQIELACLMEATARKPGNVHPTASFCDLNYNDFVRAARAISAPLAASRSTGLGQSVFQAIQSTRETCHTNVNLGISLLLAPLVSVDPKQSLIEGIPQVLSQTTVNDAEHVYEAIRLAHPGGMGDAADQDVKDRPTVSLRDAMKLAADRDRIAEQYATDFSLVLELSQSLSKLNERGRASEVKEAPGFRQSPPTPATRDSSIDQVLHRDCDWLWALWELPSNDIGRVTTLTGVTNWELAILGLQLRLLTDGPDSLVLRKCGMLVASEVQRRAARVLELQWPYTLEGWQEHSQFDHWLRADGHRRNPGTTADLIVVILFAAMRDHAIQAPSLDEVQAHAAMIQTSSKDL